MFDPFKKKALEEAIKEFNRVAAQYEIVNKTFMNKIMELYNERKTTVRVLTEFHEYVLSLKNNEHLKRMMDLAEDLNSFKDLVNKEESGETCHVFDSVCGSGSTIAAGVAGAAGVATALGGQAALWAAASAFGTTAGGTTIGSLVGIAETNAFLAWLGGGAVAAGGGGVAVGSVIFAGVPVVGWIIAALGLGAAVFTASRSRRKNAAKTEEVKEATQKLKGVISKLNKAIANASRIINRLVEKRAYLNLAFFKAYPKDCREFSTDQEKYLLECCDIYVHLCHDINVSVAD